MTTPGTGALGDFLQASRARITPEDAGLTLYGDHRRVPGLRREELAMLAGVSSSYYTRLEQGQSRNASPQVLDAIATALRLSDAERAHLGALAASTRRVAPKKPPTERADPALVELLASIGDVPAVVLGRRADVLAWNPLGHALLASHLDPDSCWSPAQRPNMASLVFLDADTRSLYAGLRAKSRAVVGNLRLVAGTHPEDPALALLIGSLTVASPEFASLWADHRVQPCSRRSSGRDGAQRGHPCTTDRLSIGSCCESIEGVLVGTLTVLALRTVFVLVLAGSVVVQVVMVPLLAADLQGLDPEHAHLRVPLILFPLLFILAIQVAAVCVWRLVTMVRRGTVFSSAAFRPVDVVIAAITAASLLTFALGVVLAPGDAVAPGVVLLVGGAGVLIAGIALIVLVLRMLLAQAVARDADARHLQAELDEVV